MVPRAGPQNASGLLSDLPSKRLLNAVSYFAMKHLGSSSSFWGSVHTRGDSFGLNCSAPATQAGLANERGFSILTGAATFRRRSGPQGSGSGRRLCANFCQQRKRRCANAWVGRLRRRFARGLSDATAAHACVVLNGISVVQNSADGVYLICRGKTVKPLAGYLAIVGDLPETG